MAKLLRLVGSIIVMVALVWLIPIVWLLFWDSRFLESLLSERYQTGNLRTVGIQDLQDVLLKGVYAIFGSATIASLLWLITAAYVPIYGPGEASGKRGWWGLYLIGGTVVTGVVAWRLFFTGIGADILGHNALLFFIGALLLYLFAYFVLGTLFTTPKRMRPAVPLASWKPKALRYR